jgi:hypothetical protein
MSIIWDAMDQTKCCVPHFHLKNKAWVTDKKKLQMQYGAFIVHGHGTFAYCWDDRMRKDADMWATLLLQTILKMYKEYQDKGKKWPETLYLQADNASDNKNLAIYAVCQLLRDLGIFKKVKLCFLPVGHTHEDIDAVFGALAKKLNGIDVYTMDGLEELWKSAWPSFRSVSYVTVSEM